MCSNVLQAMVDSAKKTTFKDDVVPVFVTVGKAREMCGLQTDLMVIHCFHPEIHENRHNEANVMWWFGHVRSNVRFRFVQCVFCAEVLGVFVILGTGNILMAGLAYWMSKAQTGSDWGVRATKPGKSLRKDDVSGGTEDIPKIQTNEDRFGEPEW